MLFFKKILPFLSVFFVLFYCIGCSTNTASCKHITLKPANKIKPYNINTLDIAYAILDDTKNTPSDALLPPKNTTGPDTLDTDPTAANRWVQENQPIQENNPQQAASSDITPDSPTVEPVYFYGDENEIRKQKLIMAKDNPYRIAADEYFEQVLEVGGPNNDFHLFDTAKKYYTAEDFKNCSEILLKLAKNEIYARHGRMFLDPDLYEYFLTRMWYEPTYTPEEFDDNCLNDCEWKNLELLLSLGA